MFLLFMLWEKLSFCHWKKSWQGETRVLCFSYLFLSPWCNFYNYVPKCKNSLISWFFPFKSFVFIARTVKGSRTGVRWEHCRVRIWPRLILTLIKEWFLEIVEPYAIIGTGALQRTKLSLMQALQTTLWPFAWNICLRLGNNHIKFICLYTKKWGD